MPRYLFIVSRRERGLFDFLRQRFADDDNVEVVLDRRARPAAPAQPPATERRGRPEVNGEIRARGYAIVTLP